MSRQRAKPVRIIPYLTDVELDSRTRDTGGRPVAPQVTDATLRRAEEALRWHEARAKRKARTS